MLLHPALLGFPCWGLVIDLAFAFWLLGAVMLAAWREDPPLAVVGWRGALEAVVGTRFKRAMCGLPAR